MTPEPKHRDEPLYRGEVAYIYAYDLAYDMKRQRVDRILSEPTKDYLVEPSKRIPKQMFFYRPLVAEFPAQAKQLASGETIQIKSTVKLFGIGVISILVRVPFVARSLEEQILQQDRFDLLMVVLEVTIVLLFVIDLLLLLRNR